jgi:hypothetical protein
VRAYDISLLRLYAVISLGTFSDEMMMMMMMMMMMRVVVVLILCVALTGDDV